MYPTLEKYIEPEHIPEKYGGKLKYKFGELPNIDPAIHDVLTWDAPHKLNGNNTFPTGPIRWLNQDKVALAVGSENGKVRERKVATLQSEKQSAPAAPAASQEEKQALYKTTSGVGTHPPTPPPNEVIPTPREGSPIYGSSTLPVRKHHMTEPNKTSENQPSTNRTGTSATSYESQAHTHAHGTLSEGTPDVREGSFGKYGVNEPNTIGQAPKEHPMPEPEPVEVSYVDQAKEVAGQAYNTAASVGASALAAVGYGSKQETQEPVEEQPKKPEDPRVDQAKDGNVEEFLRSQYPSVMAEKTQQ